MEIKTKPTVDKQKLGFMQHKLDQARADAAAAMKDLRAQRQAVGAKPGEGRVGGWHESAILNAIATEGPEVLSSAANSYWDDMRRMYPEMCADDRIPGTNSLDGTKNKYGRTKERMRGGIWEHWDQELKAWVRGEITPRKGIV